VIIFGLVEEKNTCTSFILGGEMTIPYYDENSGKFFSRTKDIDVTELYTEFLEGLPANATILDAGCGSGRDSKYFIEQGFRVFSMDGSAQLAALAADYIGQPVQHMTFAEMDKVDEFDGIWACASLLHVPRSQMADIFRRFARALKTGGLWYVSYKWGTEDREVNSRLFTDYDAPSFSAFLGQFPQLEIVHWQKTSDLLKRDIDWLNVIIRKKE
jgi:SAM-dependent methyltransferase